MVWMIVWLGLIIDAFSTISNQVIIELFFSLIYCSFYRIIIFMGWFELGYEIVKLTNMCISIIFGVLNG